MRLLFTSLLCLVITSLTMAQAQSNRPKQGLVSTHYLNNRQPLRPNPYIELPLGAIKPHGWLHEMLVRQKTGSSGRLDELYPRVMGIRNGWLGFIMKRNCFVYETY